MHARNTTEESGEHSIILSVYRLSGDVIILEFSTIVAVGSLSPPDVLIHYLIT